MHQFTLKLPSLTKAQSLYLLAVMQAALTYTLQDLVDQQECATKAIQIVNDLRHRMIGEIKMSSMEGLDFNEQLEAMNSAMALLNAVLGPETLEERGRQRLDGRR